MLRRLPLSLLAAMAPAVAAVGASAATISGDTFTATVTTDGGITELVPPTDGDALSGDPSIPTFDINGSGPDATLEVRFLNETTLEFAAFGSVGDLFDLTYSVSGLDYVSSGSPVDITGVTLINEQALRDAFDTEVFTSPTIAFTASGFTATFAEMSAGTFADGLKFQFRITTADTLAPVPVPGAGLLLAGALGALALVRRR